jgi:DNA-binding NarL/FixJ family response regulator
VGDALSPRSLLLIDPDKSVHDFLMDLLKREDRTIRNAYGRTDSLEFLRSGAFDLVIVGQDQDGFDGLQLVRQLHALQPNAKTIFTGDSDPGRVIRAIRSGAYSYFHPPLPTIALADMVQQALDAEPSLDDIIVMSARPEWVTLGVRCKMDAADRATHFFRELESELPAQMREDVVAAFRELLLNAIEHGGKYDAHKRVRASLLRTPKSIIVHIADPGKGFSLDALPHAAISNPEDSPIQHVEIRAEAGKRPGGFGILMTRNMIDELVYNERGNAVLFVKYLDGRPSDPQ